jgi:hypothetical protein
MKFKTAGKACRKNIFQHVGTPSKTDFNMNRMVGRGDRDGDDDNGLGGFYCSCCGCCGFDLWSCLRLWLLKGNTIVGVVVIVWLSLWFFLWLWLRL